MSYDEEQPVPNLFREGETYTHAKRTMHLYKFLAIARNDIS